MGLFKVMTAEERLRRKALVESLLAEGYSPVNSTLGRGSALEEADRRDGKVSGTFASWARKELGKERRGKRAFTVDWSQFQMPQQAKVAAMPAASKAVTEVDDNVDARADLLRNEILNLVLGTRFPLINPECISVTTSFTKRFDRKTQSYKSAPSTPRTWLNATPIAQAIPDARNTKWLLTAAQNDADLHEPFWENLLAYADAIDATIVTAPLTYEVSWWSESSTTSRNYPEAVLQTMCFGQLGIGSDFVFAAEMNTLVTASQPISDLTTYSRNRWCVFPHPKRQLKSVPSTDPKIQSHHVMTSGMVTRPKLVPRKAGLKSLFHHTIGAVIVEFDHLGRVFARQINASENGTFYDLTKKVENGAVTDGHRVKSIVFGDIHTRKLDPLNALGAFGVAPKLTARNYGSMLDVLKPQHVFLHDVFDHEARNHHRASDHTHLHSMAERGRDRIIDEIIEAGEFIHSFAERGCQTHIVESNHDLALTRYIKEGRYRFDGPNIAWGLHLDNTLIAHQTAVGDALDKGLPPPRFSLLEHTLRNLNPFLVSHAQWRYDGDSYLIDSVEHGHHGFRGANGSRASTMNFARMGRKISVGDRHSPEIFEGVYTAGTMTLQQGYNIGPSSWSVSHIVMYDDGHRALITMQDGAWCAEKPRVTV